MLIDERAGVVSTASSSTGQPSSKKTTAIPSEKLRQLYTTMLGLRMMQNGLLPPGRTKNHRSRFNEACEVGCTMDLHLQDVIVPLPYQVAPFTGEAPAFYSGKHTDCVATRATSWNILARERSRARLNLVTGAAFAHATRRKDSVVVVFSEPDEIARSKDALFFALDHRLPFIYVQLEHAQSNKNPRSKRSRLDPNFTAIPVDRTDAVAVYRVASEAIDRARRGVGPTLIQCVDFRLPSSRRQRSDSHSVDPIMYMESYLRNKNLWSPELEETRSQLR
jgi:pyruvate dehydrogenase E1 component alpha subunit